MNRIKNALVSIGILAATAGGLTACGSGGNYGYYDTMCVSPITQIRLPDIDCLVGGLYYNQPGYLFYAPYGYSAPGYGARITNYNTSYTVLPKNAKVHSGGIPTSGGKAPKITKGTTTTTKQGTVKPTSGSTKKGGSTSVKNPNSGGSNSKPKVNIQKPKSNSGGGFKSGGGSKSGGYHK